METNAWVTSKPNSHVGLSKFPWMADCDVYKEEMAVKSASVCVRDYTQHLVTYSRYKFDKYKQLQTYFRQSTYISVADINGTESH